MSHFDCSLGDFDVDFDTISDTDFDDFSDIDVIAKPKKLTRAQLAEFDDIVTPVITRAPAQTEIVRTNGDISAIWRQLTSAEKSVPVEAAKAADTTPKNTFCGGTFDASFDADFTFSVIPTLSKETSMSDDDMLEIWFQLATPATGVNPARNKAAKLEAMGQCRLFA